ncbi:MFS transporter [Streptomyces globisporus]|uniref:MFS transporter n=1 Tax=Streptomyces globisporus TaxID=1908 RepID=A0A927BNR5_STRGL|nr:MFS transporter [Streptomyces globisporus]
MRTRYSLRRYLVGAVVARAGDEMAGPALMLAGFAVAGSSVEASSLLAGITLSAAVGGPLLGALLDRAARPGRLLAVALVLYAAGLGAILAGLGRLPFAVTVLIAAVTGLAGPALSGGWTAQLPGVVPGDRLPGANALDAMTFSAAALTSPALAGGVAEVAGAPWAVVASVMLVALALPAAWTLPARSPVRPTRAREEGAARPVRPVCPGGMGPPSAPAGRGRLSPLLGRGRPSAPPARLPRRGGAARAPCPGERTRAFRPPRRGEAPRPPRPGEATRPFRPDAGWPGRPGHPDGLDGRRPPCRGPDHRRQAGPGPCDARLHRLLRRPGHVDGVRSAPGGARPGRGRPWCRAALLRGGLRSARHRRARPVSPCARPRDDHLGRRPGPSRRPGVGRHRVAAGARRGLPGDRVRRGASVGRPVHRPPPGGAGAVARPGLHHRRQRQDHGIRGGRGDRRPLATRSLPAALLLAAAVAAAAAPAYFAIRADRRPHLRTEPHPTGSPGCRPTGCSDRY